MTNANETTPQISVLALGRPGDTGKMESAFLLPGPFLAITGMLGLSVYQRIQALEPHHAQTVAEAVKVLHRCAARASAGTPGPGTVILHGIAGWWTEEWKEPTRMRMAWRPLINEIRRCTRMGINVWISCAVQGDANPGTAFPDPEWVLHGIGPDFDLALSMEGMTARVEMTRIPKYPVGYKLDMDDDRSVLADLVEERAEVLVGAT